MTMGTRLDERAGGEDQSAARGRCIWRLAVSRLRAARIAPSKEEALFMILEDGIVVGWARWERGELKVSSTTTHPPSRVAATSTST